jgi:hypothetical protein
VCDTASFRVTRRQPQPRSRTHDQSGSIGAGSEDAGVGLFLGGGGLAFLDVVLIPGGDLGDVGARLLDDALAAEAGVELEAGGHVEAIELEVFGLGDSLGALLQKDVAGGAGGDASAGVIEEDAVVFGNVEEAHGLAVAVVGQSIEGKLNGLIFGFEGHADYVFSGRLGKIDFREGGAFVIRHNSSSLVRAGALCSTRGRIGWSEFGWMDAWLRAGSDKLLSRRAASFCQ